MSFFFTNKVNVDNLNNVNNVDAALKIQRWWRKSKETVLFKGTGTSSTSSTSNSSDTTLYPHSGSDSLTSILRKRKFDDLDEDYETEGEVDTSSEEDNDNHIQVRNNFLLEFIYSLFLSFCRLFGF